jgi:hypothetical protein
MVGLKNHNPHGVQVGEVWEENNPQRPRMLKVVGLISRWGEFGHADVENISSGKRSRIRLDRFNGTRGGLSRVT